MPPRLMWGDDERGIPRRIARTRAVAACAGGASRLAVTTVNRWALALAPVPQYAVAYLELRRELAEISRRLSDAGHAMPAPRKFNHSRRATRGRVFAVGDDLL